MSKVAHIYNDHDAKVGDRALGICGKDFKIKVALWADLPKDYPICRNCVDTAIGAMKEADAIIQTSRLYTEFLVSRVERLNNVLNPEQPLLLDLIDAADTTFQDSQALKQAEKEIEAKAKRTCTCTWTSPEIFTEDPNCPIHGGDREEHMDAIGVDVPTSLEED
jgi:hypothetical protein